jgi:hypothetical protein
MAESPPTLKPNKVEPFEFSPISTRGLRATRKRSEDLVLTYRFHGFQQIARSVRLHDITSRTSVQRFAHHLWRIVLSHEQNLEACNLPLLLDEPAGF